MVRSDEKRSRGCSVKRPDYGYDAVNVEHEGNNISDVFNGGTFRCHRRSNKPGVEPSLEVCETLPVAAEMPALRIQLLIVSRSDFRQGPFHIKLTCFTIGRTMFDTELPL